MFRPLTLATVLTLAVGVSGCAERRLAPATAPPAPSAEAESEASGSTARAKGESEASGSRARADAESAASGSSARADARDRQLERRRRVATGLASYYGRAFHGKETASGTTFNMNTLVAAHPHYPFGTRVRVTNLENGRKVVVKVVDRGPTQENVREGVIIDLSRRAAAVLGFIEDGRQRVRLEILEWGDS